MDCKLRIVTLSLCGLFLTLTGCGDSASNAPTAAISSGQQTANAPTAKPAPKADTPADAVTSFLEAVRTGDTDVSRGMLTQLALEKTEEYNLNFSPPGSETATFIVGEVRAVTANEAHVATIWTDLDENGNTRPENITWMVKQEGSKWRIYGLVADLGPDMPPQQFNFEQPDELARRQQGAQEDSVADQVEPVQPPDRTAVRQDDPFRDSPR